MKQVPSLKAKLGDADWWEVIWGDAVSQAAKETGLGRFPEFCPWPFEQVMSPDFWPD